MRASTTIALLIGALGACMGASMTYRAPQNGGAPPARKAQDEIDKRSVAALTAVNAPADFGARAMEHARTLVAFGPRNPGTPGWSQQLDHIQRTLEGLGLRVQRDTWTDRKEMITFSNLAAVIPGKKPERIVLACHHDTKCTTGHPDPANNFHFVGANDGASGVALLLALAPLLKERANTATIERVFFDGEESLDWRWNDGARAMFGSKRFCKRHRDAELLGEGSRIGALVLLDMVGRSDLHIQEELYSTSKLREFAWSAAVATGHDKQFFQRAEAASDDHVPFLDVGIPAIDLIDLNGNPHWHKATDTLENLSASSLQAVADVILTMLPTIESHYVATRGN